MARVIIPERVCPHCGGTEWYTQNFNTRKKKIIGYACVKKRHEYDLIYKQKKDVKRRTLEASRRRRENISDSYLRNLFKMSGTDINLLTEEDLQIYREGIKVRRIHRKLIKNGGQVMKTMSVEEKKAKKRKYMKNWYAMKHAERKALNDASLNHLANESVVGGVSLYSDEQCRLLLSAHEEGKSYSEIARMYAKAWNRTEAGIAFKISSLLKGRSKAKPVSKPVVKALSFEETLKKMLEEKTIQFEKLNEEINAIKVLLK